MPKQIPALRIAYILGPFKRHLNHSSSSSISEGERSENVLSPSNDSQWRNQAYRRGKWVWTDRDKNWYSRVFGVAKTNGEQFKTVPWQPGPQKGELGMDCSDRDKNWYSGVFEVAKTNGEQFQMVPWLPVVCTFPSSIRNLNARQAAQRLGF